MNPLSRAVFISYASEDAAAARRLCEAMRSAGVEVWFDQLELVGGDQWDQKIRKQIRTCALFVPIISASTQARAEGYFRREWKLAAERMQDIADHVTFLLPVVLDTTRDSEAHVPEVFLKVQWTRLNGVHAEEAFVRRVQAVLGISAPEGMLSRTDSPPAAAGARMSPVPAAHAKTRRSFSRWRAGAWFAAVGLVLAMVGTWWFAAEHRERPSAALEEIAQINRLIESEAYPEAYRLAKSLVKRSPESQGLAEIWPKITTKVAVRSEPEGASLEVRDYANPDEVLLALNAVSGQEVEIPRGLMRWKLSAPGCRTLESAQPAGPKMAFVLARVADLPEEMVAIPSGVARAWITGMDPIESVQLEGYLIDRHEVTNRRFKAFVDAGGYQRREFWKQPFRKEGASLTWEEAMTLFHDATGRPGPAAWEFGTYARGQDEYPVGGVSWYEAAAYAEFAGKSLPTIFHWVRAASTEIPSAIVARSNFGGKAPSPVGASGGMSAYGVYDMAGNMREWLWNASGEMRHILGGAWNDPTYLFTSAGIRAPLDRSLENGFRCVGYKDGKLPNKTSEPVLLSHRNYDREQPVSDELYRIFLNQFSYDAAALDVRVESTDETPDWRHELLSVAAAYGNERLPLHVYIPKNSSPPFQPLVEFPSSMAVISAESSTPRPTDYLIKSGKVVILPVYKGTYGRREGMTTTWPSDTHKHSEFVIKQVKDFRRAVDYAISRPDFEAERLAYFGTSWGGRMGAIIPAVEKRVKVAVLISGGLPAGRALPEVDALNFVTRVTVPVLMVNGRQDPIQQLQTAQLPMFRLLGSPLAQKRHLIFETGHGPYPRNLMIKEVLDWLDRYPARKDAGR